MGKIYARAIRRGKKTLADVPAKYVEESRLSRIIWNGA